MPNFKVGYFNLNTTTGDQSVIGIGFAPKWIIFFNFSIIGTPSGWRTSWRNSLGIAAIKTGTTIKQGSVYSGALDASAAGSATSGMSYTIIARAESGGIIAAGNVKTFDADGFTVTLDYATGGANYAVGFLACDTAIALETLFEGDTTTGQTTYIYSGFDAAGTKIGGINFYYETAPGVIARACQGIGAWDGTNQWGQHFFGKSATSNSYGRQTTSHSLMMVAPTTGNNDIRTNFDSVSGDNVVYDCVQNSSTGIVWYFHLAGFTGAFSFKVGSFTKTTSAAPVAQAVTGIGFQPKALFLTTYGRAASSSSQAEWTQGIGVTDGTNSIYGMQQYRDTGVDVNSYMDASNCIGYPSSSASQTKLAEAAISSLDADGFTLNWTTNDATASEILYIAFGDPVGGGGGSGIDDELLDYHPFWCPGSR